MFRPDYIVPITVRYKDFDENLYESTSELHYVPARIELAFGPTKQRKVDASSDAKEHARIVLQFMQGDHQMGQSKKYLVENIASAVPLPEQETADALIRLLADGMVYRSKIEAKWDYVYWLAHY